MSFEGKDILTLALPHKGERYILGARAPLLNPNHKGPWDCAEFVSWCAFQVYKIVFGSDNKNPASADPYSGQWYVDAKHAGTLVSVETALATPGAFVVRRPGEFNLKIGHIAISLGDDRLVEARGAATGVVVSTGAHKRSWSSGLFLPGVQYETGAEKALKPPIGILKLTNPYMRGDAVAAVQAALAKEGFNPGKPDGVFGVLTATAVANFQMFKGLVPDGEVGPDTAKALGLGWPL